MSDRITRITGQITAVIAALICLLTILAFRSVQGQDKTTQENLNMTEISMMFGSTKISAVLDDSETSKAFINLLPLTLNMRRYADREYYAAIDALPEEGELIPDFENGDVTYYTAGKSLAIFFGNEENSSQDGLIRMGRITSDLSLFDKMNDSMTVTIDLAESEDTMSYYDFSVFPNVEITGTDITSLTDEELSVLYRQAKYCQAMTDADIDALREIVSEDMIFTHMSGMQQTREQYFADIAAGRLNYFTIGIENPQISVDNDNAEITFTSVLNANAYGARGTFRMKGTHHFEKRDGEWIAVNGSK
jgi:ketosteroid isomerase-like protein